MKGPDVIRQPLGVIIATFAAMLACVVVRATSAPYPAESALCADMPLGRAIDSLLPAGAASCTAGVLATFLNATLLAGMIVRYSVSTVRTYLPMIIYLMAACGVWFPVGSASAALVPLLLTAAAIQSIAAFKRSYQFGHVFKSAFCVGLIPMIYAPAVLIVPIVPVTLALYRRTPREAVVAVAGLFLPLLMCSVVWWGLGEPFRYTAASLYEKTFAATGGTTLAELYAGTGAPVRAYLGLFAALTLCSVCIILRALPALRTRARKIYIHFLWLSVLCLATAFLPGSSLVSLGMLAVPCCVTVSACFIRHRGWIPFAAYLLLAVLMLYINLFPVRP